MEDLLGQSQARVEGGDVGDGAGVEGEEAGVEELGPVAGDGVREGLGGWEGGVRVSEGEVGVVRGERHGSP